MLHNGALHKRGGGGGGVATRCNPQHNLLTQPGIHNLLNVNEEMWRCGVGAAVCGGVGGVGGAPAMTEMKEEYTVIQSYNDARPTSTE